MSCPHCPECKLRGLREQAHIQATGYAVVDCSVDTALQSGCLTGTWTYFGRSIPPWIEEGFVDLAAGPGGVISSVEELVRQTV